MEARIARLESDVAHLRTDVADIKVDLRSVRDKLDALNENVTATRESLATTKLELTSALGGTKHDLAGAIHSAVVWALFLYLGLAAVLLSTMARAFGWI